MVLVISQEKQNDKGYNVPGVSAGDSLIQGLNHECRNSICEPPWTRYGFYRVRYRKSGDLCVILLQGDIDNYSIIRWYGDRTT